MSKEYIFDQKKFLIRVVYAGLLAVLVLLLGVFHISRGSSLKYLWIFVCFLSLYTIITNFISISYPRKIKLADNKLTFSAFGKSHVYSLAELEGFRIRERHLAKKMYIRVNKPSLFKGRYWIDLRAYNDYQDLNEQFLSLEESLHPDSLKAKIKKNNALYAERKKQNV